jgi:hypothetical protein
MLSLNSSTPPISPALIIRIIREGHSSATEVPGKPMISIWPIIFLSCACSVDLPVNDGSPSPFQILPIASNKQPASTSAPIFKLLAATCVILDKLGQTLGYLMAIFSAGHPIMELGFWFSPE